MRTRLLETELYSASQLASSVTFHYKTYELIYNEFILQETGIDVMKDPNYDSYYSKYYMNLRGECHEIDGEGLLVTCLEDNVNRYLNKDNIKLFPKTENELRYNLNFKNNVIKNNPNKAILLNGILNPVTKDVRKYKDGVILSYEKSLLEENEEYLINELNLFLQTNLRRWSNPYFTFIDKEYTTLLFSEIYASMIQFIIVKRYGHHNTYKGNENLVNIRLLNKLGIDKQVLNLPKNIKYFFNKNIDYLINNIGYKSQIKVLIENVFDKLRIPVYKLKNKRVTKDRKYNILQLESISNANYIDYEVDSATIAKAILNNQSVLGNTYTEFEEINQKISEELFNINYSSEYPYYVIGNIDFSSLTFNNRVELIIPILINYLKDNNDIFTYVDEKLNLVYEVKGHELFELLILVLGFITDKDFFTNGKIVLANVYEDNNESLLDLVNDDQGYIQVLENIKPKSTNIKDFTLELLIYSLAIKKLKNNLDNEALYAELLAYYKKSFKYKIIDLNGDKDTLISKYSKFGITLPDVKFIDIVRNITMTVLDIPLFKYDEYAKIVNDLSIILDKLTAYDVSVLKLDATDNGSIRTTNIGLIKNVNLIKIRSSFFRCLEENPSYLLSASAVKNNEFMHCYAESSIMNIDWFKIKLRTMVNTGIDNITYMMDRRLLTPSKLKVFFKMKSLVPDGIEANIENNMSVSYKKLSELKTYINYDHDLDTLLVYDKFYHDFGYRGKGSISAYTNETLGYYITPDNVTITGDGVMQGLLLDTVQDKELRSLTAISYISTETPIEIYKPKGDYKSIREDIDYKFISMPYISGKLNEDRRLRVVYDKDPVMDNLIVTSSSLPTNYRGNVETFRQLESVNVRISDDLKVDDIMIEMNATTVEVIDEVKEFTVELDLTSKPIEE